MRYSTNTLGGFIAITCFLITIVNSPLARAEDSPRAPIPSDEDYQKSIEKLRDLFPRDFANAESKPKYKKALADKLMKLAAETVEPLDRYAMLKQSYDLLLADAVEVESAVPAVMKCADALAADFEVSSSKLKAKVFTALAEDRKSTLASVRQLEKLLASAVQDAVDHDDFVSAGEICNASKSFSKRLMNKTLDEARSEIELDSLALAAQHSAYSEALELLEKAPDDEGANRTVAIYLGLRKGEWLAGERHVQHGGDETLQRLFVRTADESLSADQMVSLADDWWGWAGEVNGIEAKQAKTVAAELYSRSEKNVTGLSKKTASERKSFGSRQLISVRSKSKPPVPEPPEPAKYPLDAMAAKSHQQRWAKYLNSELSLDNSLGMSFVLIPPGEFEMGSPAGEQGHQANEMQHRVTITNPFYLGVHEVTQSQYTQVMGKNPSKFLGPQVPVADVTWLDAVEFCRRLTSIEKLGNREYRLPTEAEWEYACRGGTSTDHYGTAAGYQLGDVAWYRGNSGLKNQPVGLKLPNAWGLYDMHGNVWEWSLDGFQLYKQGAESTNPKGEMGLQVPRVIRGGGAGGDFASPYEECRSAHRHVRQIGDAGTNLGFRILLEVSKGDEE